MLPELTLPPSPMALLACFEPLFTVPSFRTFCALAAGFLTQTGRRTVCGMLTGAAGRGIVSVRGRRAGTPQKETQSAADSPSCVGSQPGYTVCTLISAPQLGG